jgi:putative oxidoreductase
MKVTLDINARSVLRWIIGLLLVWAAISKLANLQEFYGDLAAYKLPLPAVFQRLIAISLPWLELFCGLMLLARFRSRAALLWAVFLFGAFVIATGQAWARGLQISCGCFDLGLIGVTAESELGQAMKTAWFAFFRALLLLAAAMFLFRESTRSAANASEALRAPADGQL